MSYDRYFQRWGAYYMPFEDWKWFKAQAIQESGLDPRAQSWCGAMGLMQLMPKTAEGLKVSNPWDAEQNIQGGIKYDAQMRKIFGDRDLQFAAYNAGPGNVKKAIKRFADSTGFSVDDMEIIENKWEAVSPYLPLVTGTRNAAETTGYVKRINKLYKGIQ